LLLCHEAITKSCMSCSITLSFFKKAKAEKSFISYHYYTARQWIKRSNILFL
jgi:hypothetical protein